jgi:hypothetical protein
MPNHVESHPLRGKTVKIVKGKFAGQDYRLEDWWDHELVGGKSWMFSDGNPACLMYAIRAAEDGLPTDNEVVYGKIGSLGHLVHTSELEVQNG